MLKSLLLLMAVVLVALTSAPARLHSAEPTLQAGVQQVRDGDFDAGVVTLDGVIRRLGAESPARAGDLSQAYLYKGVALVGLEQEEPAKTAFRDALKHDPQLQLSEREFSPRVVRVFDAARKGKSKSVLYASGGVGIGAIVAGVALAGGGATAVAATAGPAPTPAPTASPTPLSNSARLLSTSPPAGSTIRAQDFRNVTLAFEVTRSSTIPGGNLVVILRPTEGGTDCGILESDQPIPESASIAPVTMVARGIYFPGAFKTSCYDVAINCYSVWAGDATPDGQAGGAQIVPGVCAGLNYRFIR